MRYLKEFRLNILTFGNINNDFIIEYMYFNSWVKIRIQNIYILLYKKPGIGRVKI